MEQSKKNQKEEEDAIDILIKTKGIKKSFDRIMKNTNDKYGVR